MVKRLIPGLVGVNSTVCDSHSGELNSVCLEVKGGAAWEMSGQGCQTSHLLSPIGTAFVSHSLKPRRHYLLHLIHSDKVDVWEFSENEEIYGPV